MSRGSLNVSSEGIENAKQALVSCGLTQKALGEELEISRSTISKFFNGKKVDRSYFLEICHRLELNWQEVFEKPSIYTKSNQSLSLEYNQINDSQRLQRNYREDKSNIRKQEYLDTKVQEIKDLLRPYIQEQYGIIRVLEMSQPISLETLFTQVNILEKISSKQRKPITELIQNCTPDNFDRLGLNRIVKKKISGFEAVKNNPKLMILGKPGAGKTTFMKHLALQSIWNKFQIERIPIFVTLKSFAEAPKSPSLQKFIFQQLGVHTIHSSQIRSMIQNGRALFLFDGLDEVKKEDTERVLREIQDFYNCFYFSKEFKQDQNDYINKRLRNYQEIERNKKEVRNLQLQLDEEQKELNKEKNSSRKDKIITKSNISKINHKIDSINKSINYKSGFINRKIDELSHQPDISKETDQGLKTLSKKFPNKCYVNHFVITCRIAAKDFYFENFTEVEVADFDEQQITDFSHKWFTSKQDPIKAKNFLLKIKNNPPIQDLATNPLLLTLLCLVFEDSADFPANRSELYKEGIDILLKKWDAKRNIERSQIYKNLSRQRKEDLLSKIAFSSFKRGEYFFKQNLVEQQIQNYIKNLPDVSSDSKDLQLDCEAILKAIEAQHGLLVERALGIYSFSHLTFQEYFTARQIVCSAWQDINSNFHSSLKNLITHISDKRWREVFLLTLGMLPNADYPIQLIKEYIDSLLEGEQEIQNFLGWLNLKVMSLEISENIMMVRAFYFEISLGYYDSNRIYDVDISTFYSKYQEAFFDYNLLKYLKYSLILNHKNARELYANHNKFLDSNFVQQINPALKKELENLKDKLPYPGELNEAEEFSIFSSWWRLYGNDWSLQLRRMIIKYRNIGHAWNFTDLQIGKLTEYHSANKLLVDFLNSDLYISVSVRKAVEETILLPLENTNISSHLNK